MSKSLLPKSKAKTAYGLLSEIAALAIAEPKRIAMFDWLSKRANANVFSRIKPEDYPACGTVGCIAGWAITIKPTRARSSKDVYGYTLTEDVGDRAERLLGLSQRQGYRLFRSSELTTAPYQQTPEHARAVVAHIRKFQKKYRAQLLAKRIR